jgi:hypothetical protein
MQSTSEFTIDDLGFVSLAPTKVLLAASRGEIDLNVLAKQVLAGRGLDQQGQWVGFERAKEIHSV